MNRAPWPAGHSPLRLTCHTDNSRPWVGLASVSVHLFPHPGLGSLTLELAFDPNPTPVFTRTFEQPTPFAIRFGIPTHRLPDGPGRLTFTAKQAGRAWTLRLPFIVSNPSVPLVSTRRLRALV